MARKFEAPSFFVTPKWRLFSSEDGTWPTETIGVGASIDAAVTLHSLDATLRAIHHLLLQLGKDGIHVVIREHARRARLAEQTRRRRRRQAQGRRKAARR